MVVVATVMVQDVLVEVVFGSSSRGFVVLVVKLDGFRLVSWFSRRMALWC